MVHLRSARCQNRVLLRRRCAVVLTAPNKPVSSVIEIVSSWSTAPTMSAHSASVQKGSASQRNLSTTRSTT